MEAKLSYITPDQEHVHMERKGFIHIWHYPQFFPTIRPRPEEIGCIATRYSFNPSYENRYDRSAPHLYRDVVEERIFSVRGAIEHGVCYG